LRLRSHRPLPWDPREGRPSLGCGFLLYHEKLAREGALRRFKLREIHP
jgi:hypothetical protein